jgi:hypothetical protein
MDDGVEGNKPTWCCKLMQFSGTACTVTLGSKGFPGEADILLGVRILLESQP